MNYCYLTVYSIFAVLLLGTPPAPPSPSDLLNEADTAFANGDYATAVELYEQAEPRAADPGRVTLSLAAAKYRLALSDPSRASSLLSEAEELYRCCLDPSEPRRVAALVGMGNCLLRKAGDRDAGAALSATDHFAEAGRDPSAATLAADARYNLQLARLLARQIPVIDDKPKEDKPPSEDHHERQPPSPRPEPKPETDNEGESDRGDSKNGTSEMQANSDDKQTNASDDNTQQTAGQGKDPKPIPNSDEEAPLTPQDAREHLKQATRHIIDEGRRHRLSAVRPPAPGVRDW